MLKCSTQSIANFTNKYKGVYIETTILTDEKHPIVCFVHDLTICQETLRLFLKVDRWFYDTLFEHGKHPKLYKWMCMHHGPHSKKRVRSRSKPILVSKLLGCDNVHYPIVPSQEYEQKRKHLQKIQDTKFQVVHALRKHPRTRELPECVIKTIVKTYVSTEWFSGYE